LTATSAKLKMEHAASLNLIAKLKQTDKRMAEQHVQLQASHKEQFASMEKLEKLDKAEAKNHDFLKQLQATKDTFSEASKLDHAKLQKAHQHEVFQDEKIRSLAKQNQELQAKVSQDQTNDEAMAQRVAASEQRIRAHLMKDVAELKAKQKQLDRAQAGEKAMAIQEASRAKANEKARTVEEEKLATALRAKADDELALKREMAKLHAYDAKLKDLTKLEETKESKRTKKGQLEVLEDKIDNLHKTCDFLLAEYAKIKEERTKEEEGLKASKAVLSGAKVGFLQH